MARDVESLLLVMSADIRQLKRGMQEASGVFDREAARIEKRSKQLEREVEKIGEGIGRAWKKAGLAAGVALGAIIGYSVKAAAEAVEMRNAFDLAFGAGSKGAEQFAKDLSEKVGRGQLDVMQSMTRFRLLFKNQADGVADQLTKGLQERAIDVGSLFNLKDDAVVQKFFSGITGETEPLKALGVTLNEAAVKAELLRLGFKGTTSQASENAKQIARYNIIMRETAKANGDAANTAESTANQFKRLQGEVKDSAAKLGEQFLPVADKLLKFALEALTAFNKLPEGMQLAGLAALALVAASGPITKLIIGLQAIIKYGLAARAAIIAATAAGAVGGAASGAAAAGGAVAGAGAVAAGTAGVGVATAAAVLSLKGDSAPQRQKELTDQERLNSLLVNEVKYRNEANAARAKAEEFRAKGQNLRASGQEGIARQMDELAQSTHSKAGGLKLKLDIAALPIGGPKAAENAAAQTLKELGLSPELLKPVGGDTKTGRGGSKTDPAIGQADRANAALGRAEDQELAARQALATTAAARAQVELDRLDAEGRSRDLDLDLAVKAKQLTAPQAELIKAAEGRVRDAERQKIIQERDIAVAEHRRAQDQALERFAAEELSARAGVAKSATESADLELKRLAAEHDSFEQELELSVLRGDKTQAEADELRAAEARAQAAQKDAVGAHRDEQVAKDLVALKQADLEGQIEALTIAEAMATTQAERRDIELRILDLQRQREKVELESVLASKEATDNEKALAAKRLEQLKAIEPAQREQVKQGTRGPLETFIAENSGAAHLRETIEEIGVRSFDQLADALAAAAGDAKNLGEVARNIFRQMITDLLSAQIKRAGVALFAGLHIPGFAEGTDFAPGGLAWVGERGRELVNLPRGSQVIPHATLSAVQNLKQGSLAPAQITVLQENHLHAEHGVLTPELIASFDRKLVASRDVAVQQAVRAARRGMPSAAIGYQRLGTS